MNEERKIEVEEVTEAAKPPKARVGATFERKRDYLAGFLEQTPAQAGEHEPGGDLYEAVIQALKDAGRTPLIIPARQMPRLHS